MCENKVGGVPGYECTCVPGYEKALASIVEGEPVFGCDDVDECATDDACTAHAACTNVDGSFTCECEDGFSKNEDDECIDDDECADETTCGEFSKCQNTEGTYECVCDEGYRLDKSLGFPICEGNDK